MKDAPKRRLAEVSTAETCPGSVDSPPLAITPKPVGLVSTSENMLAAARTAPTMLRASSPIARPRASLSRRSKKVVLLEPDLS